MFSPRVADPLIATGNSSVVSLVDQFFGQLSLLLLVLVMNDEDGEVGLFGGATEGFGGFLDVLFKLADGVLEGRAGVVNLVDNEDVLTDQVGHLERGQVEPLCASDLGARDLLGGVGAKGLVERKTDGLDGDVGVSGLLEERTVSRVRLGQPSKWSCTCRQEKE